MQAANETTQVFPDLLAAQAVARIGFRRGAAWAAQYLHDNRPASEVRASADAALDELANGIPAEFLADVAAHDAAAAVSQ